MSDFEPDFFSITDIPLMQPKEKFALQITEIIKNNYSCIGELIEIYSFNSLELNSRNVKIVTDSGEFVLKGWTRTTIERVHEIVEVLNFLQFENLRVPGPVRNDSGKDLSFFNEASFTLFRFVEGDLFNPTENNIEEFFNATGMLFSKLKEYKAGTFTTTFKYPSPLFIQNSLASAINDPSIWRVAETTNSRETLKQILPLIARDLKSFPTEFDQGKLQYSHYDLHPKNVVTDQNQGFGFLDFDSCAISNPNIAWGYLLIKNLRQAIVNGTDRDSPSELALKALFHLRNTEFAQNLDVGNLPLYGRYEISRRLAYIIDEYLINKSTTWMNMLPIQIQLLRESYILFEEKKLVVE